METAPRTRPRPRRSVPLRTRPRSSSSSSSTYGETMPRLASLSAVFNEQTRCANTEETRAARPRFEESTIPLGRGRRSNAHCSLSAGPTARCFGTSTCRSGELRDARTDESIASRRRELYRSVLYLSWSWIDRPGPTHDRPVDETRDDVRCQLDGRLDDSQPISWQRENTERNAILRAWRSAFD